MNFDTGLKMIAGQYGMTPEAVRREMQAVIDESYQKNDPAVRAAWKRIPFQGDRPTPEDVIIGIARKLRHRR